MTRDQAVEYLGLRDGDKTDTTDGNLAVIEFACDRGFYLDCWDELPVEYTIGRQTGLYGYDDYEGDLEADLTCVARGAVNYLRDEGLLPQGYGYDPQRPGDGFGFDETTRGEGS